MTSDTWYCWWGTRGNKSSGRQNCVKRHRSPRRRFASLLSYSQVIRTRARFDATPVNDTQLSMVALTPVSKCTTSIDAIPRKVSSESPDADCLDQPILSSLFVFVSPSTEPVKIATVNTEFGFLYSYCDPLLLLSRVAMLSDVAIVVVTVVVVVVISVVMSFGGLCMRWLAGSDTSKNIDSCLGHVGSVELKTMEVLCVELPNFTLAYGLIAFWLELPPNRLATPNNPLGASLFFGFSRPRAATTRTMSVPSRYSSMSS
mmetsp:Transcript_14537/g.40094  ORF Transcript_14537/g.40094 Transcript_14537/m.40094 type:complete len:259 (-) Transcript_14537:66-842(-)